LVEYAVIADAQAVKFVFAPDLFDSLGLRILRQGIYAPSDARPDRPIEGFYFSHRPRRKLNAIGQLDAQLGFELFPGDGALFVRFRQRSARLFEVDLIFQRFQ